MIVVYLFFSTFFEKTASQTFQWVGLNESGSLFCWDNLSNTGKLFNLTQTIEVSQSNLSTETLLWESKCF